MAVTTVLDLVKPGHTQSTGLVLTYGEHFVFACGQQRYWRDGSIPIIGIGGKREPGETFAEAASREAREEASITPVLMDSPWTWLFTEDEEPVKHRLEEVPAPTYVWERPITLGDGVPPTPYFCVVYQGAADREPVPTGEIPALVYLSDEAVELMAVRGRLRQDQLVAAGGFVKSVKPLPIGADLVPQGSAEYFFKWHLVAGGTGGVPVSLYPFCR